MLISATANSESIRDFIRQNYQSIVDQLRAFSELPTPLKGFNLVSGDRDGFYMCAGVEAFLLCLALFYDFRNLRNK